MKHCESVPIDLIDGRAVYKGREWPAEIDVMRELLEYPQGQHVQFGRRGALQFFCVNGHAAYRRMADIMGGWRYVKTDSKLDGANATGSAGVRPADLALRAVMHVFRDRLGRSVEAFQWLPHAVPPVALPDWFLRADFEQNKDGILTIRTLGGVAKAEPSNWIMMRDGKISVAPAKQFAVDFAQIAA